MGFASGFSAGANAVNSYESRKRQEKLDEQNASLHAERMDEIKQAKADKQALRDAGAERTTMQGTAVTTGAGDKNLYADPMQAANAAEDAKIEAEMRGQQPGMVNMQAATGITGKMATGHQITTDPVDLKAINGAEAKAGRFQSALEAQGKPMEAMQMGNAVMENKAKKMGLEVAELDFANRKFNTDVLTSLDSDPDWTKGAAGLLTKTQLGGLAGMTVTPSVSTDGKTVSFIGAGADGASKTLATLPNTPQGKLQFTQKLLKASPEMKVSWLVENAKTAKAEIEAAQKQDNWLKDYGLKEKEVNSKGELRVAQAEAAALRGSIAAGRASSSGPGAGTAEPAFNPLGSFDSKKAQAVAFEQASKMTTDATGAPVSPEAQGQLAQKIYRSMEDAFATESTARQRGKVFKSEATKATTPEEVQALRARASQSGYTDQEMAQLDQRFAPPKVQAETKPAPGAPARPAKAPAYVPPANSPAGKAAANRDASKAVSMEKTMQAKKAVTDAAASAIQSGDASAAQAAQDMDGFSALPADTKAQIRKIVFGR